MRKTPILLLAATVAVLALPGAASAASGKLVATLAGANETGGGDPKGSGKLTAEYDTESGDFCYTLSGSGIGAATAAHIHTGAAGADGAPVIPLQVTGDGSDECVAVEPDTIKAIAAAPASYYANIHTAAFPKGAVRGQLSVVK